MSSRVQRLLDATPSFKTVLLVSAFLRVALILYSEWHDSRSVVKYTDVDYRVFSDAAQFVLHPSEGNIGQGPLGAALGVGDPYTRATYRYTPLLALLLTPNEWLHPSFGKYLFAACDLVAGVLLHRLLRGVVLPSLVGNASGVTKVGSESSERQATLLAAVHLLNPMVFAISTRGSAESVLVVLVLATLACALRGRWDAAAVLLGLSTHWKIYPFVYGVACLGVIGSERGVARGWKGWLRSLVNLRTLRFAAISVGTFALLGAAMYAIWGHPFLYETYLYHLHRIDHRHNFSPYFYLMYLSYTPGTHEAAPPAWRQLLRSPLTSFAPQMVLALGTGVLFGRRREDLAFAWFVQTFAFVVFNKVCTSQYFLWYLLFLPLLVPRLNISARRAALLAFIWAATQGMWLAEAYRLEFMGQNVFLRLWARGLFYVIGNCAVLAGVMEAYSR